MRHQQSGHKLPVNNYSARGVGPILSLTVHCGRCKASFEPDRDWVKRYVDSELRKIRSHPDRDQTRVLEAALAKQERHMLDFIKKREPSADSRIVHLRLVADGAKTLPAVSRALRALATELDDLTREGWQLEQPVDAGWVHLEKYPEK